MKKNIESWKNKTAIEINELMVDYARDGDIEKIRVLLFNSDLTNNADILYQNSLIIMCACASGSIELVKYLLTSPELKVKPDINAQSDLALTCACQIGSLEIVKYLIESPELENHSKVPFINNSPNNPIIISAKNKKLDVLEYLVSISENKDKDLFSYINNALSTASLSGDIDMVNFLLKFSEEKSNKEKDSIYLEASLTRVIQSALISDKIDLAEYILNSPKFSPYIDLHQNDDYLFNSLVAKANLNNTFETLHYLIFELNIPQTNSIIKIIKDYPCPEVEKMFSLRELHKDLKKDLNFNITDQKKIKI